MFFLFLFVWECVTDRQTDQSELLYLSFSIFYYFQTIKVKVIFKLFHFLYYYLESIEVRHNVGRTSHISQEVTHKRSLLVQQKTFCVRFWALKRPYTQIEFCFFDYNTLLRCSLITPLVCCCWCITVYLRVSAFPCAVCCIPFLPVAINSSLFVLLFMSRSYVPGISCITYRARW